MTELIIGIVCCLLMAGTLHSYLQCTKRKYYNGKDQPSLSNTFYKTGWVFRALLIFMGISMIYPILLANGYVIDGTWVYSAPTVILSWSKLAFAIAIGGIIGVALCADYAAKESSAHVAAASIVAAGGAMVGCMLRQNWYIGVGVWLAWLVYYLIKNHRNNKAGNPSAFGLYIEEVAFYSVPTCLIIYMVMNYFI